MSLVERSADSSSVVALLSQSERAPRGPTPFVLWIMFPGLGGQPLQIWPGYRPGAGVTPCRPLLLGQWWKPLWGVGTEGSTQAITGTLLAEARVAG